MPDPFYSKRRKYKIGKNLTPDAAVIPEGWKPCRTSVKLYGARKRQTQKETLSQ